jgi:hypothetical protein
MERRVGGGGLVVPSAGLQSFTYIALLPVYEPHGCAARQAPRRRWPRRHHDAPARWRWHGDGLPRHGRGGAHRGETAPCGSRHQDRPDATVPMDVWWLVPQHVLVGVAKVLTVIVLEEFFYELHIVRLAVSLRSLCPRAISSHQATFQRK